MQLGRHSLQLGAIEHTHHGCFNHIIKMMSQCNFVAAQLLGLLVQVAAAHAGAQVTGGFIAVVGNCEHIRLKNCDGDIQQCGVAFDLLAVDLIIAGVHHQKHQLKGHIAVALQLLHQFSHQHAVLAAGNAHGNFISRLHQFIALDRHNKRGPQLFAVFFDNAAFNQLAGFHLAFQWSFLLLQILHTAVKRRQKSVQFLFGGQVAQADAP